MTEVTDDLAKKTIQTSFGVAKESKCEEILSFRPFLYIYIYIYIPCNVLRSCAGFGTKYF